MSGKKGKSTFGWRMFAASKPANYWLAKSGFLGDDAKASAEDIEPVMAIAGLVVLIVLGLFALVSWIQGLFPAM